MIDEHEGDFIGRLRVIYENERGYTVGRAMGEPVDQREIQARSVIKAANEVLNDEQVMDLCRRAIQSIARQSDKLYLPRFDEGGSCRLRMDGILRVAENLIVGVEYATEDDWLAYLDIKRTNAMRQQRSWANTEQGIVTIVGGIRSYAQRSGTARARTLDALPYLFDHQERDAA